MARCIEVGVALNELEHTPFYDKRDYETTKEMLKTMPTADVVEVVRCKDCKYNPDTNDDDQCPFVESDGHVEHFPEDDFFCKYGERKETLTTKA